MSLYDNIVGVFSPAKKLSNLRTRRAIEIMEKRGYDGAKTGRRTSGWNTPSTSANAEIGPNITKLRDRSRDLVRNNPYASKAIRVLTSNVVGKGIVPNIPDNKTSELWESWALEADQCDADGCMDFYGIQRLVARTLFEAGECLIRLRYRKLTDNLVVPMQLQVLEPDYLDSTKFEKLKNGGYIQHGIEYDAIGGRAAYWIYKEHPGELSPLNKGIESTRVPAKDIIHIYDKLRPGQSRGVPVLAPAMITANDLDEYEEATLVRKAGEALITAVVQSEDDGASLGNVTTDQDQRQIEEMAPGMIEYLNSGESITFNNPPASNGYSEYVNTRLHAIAAGSGVTYEQMTGDLSQVNYSSIRSGTLDFRREVEQIQWLLFIPGFCRRVIRAWSASASLVNKRVKLPARIDWTTPRFDWVDPKKDVEAETEELSTNRMSFSEAARKRGHNPQKLVDEIAEDRKMFEAAGMPYPFDVIEKENTGESDK